MMTTKGEMAQVMSEILKRVRATGCNISDNTLEPTSDWLRYEFPARRYDSIRCERRVNGKWQVKVGAQGEYVIFVERKAGWDIEKMVAAALRVARWGT